MTPEEFKYQMLRAANTPDTELSHIRADELMCEILEELGYGEGIFVFRDMAKWYS